MKIFILAVVFASLAQADGCLPVAGDRITGRDLALANPAFAALPASLTVAFSPVPGTRRIFAQDELERLARANNVSFTGSNEICFEIPMRAIEENDVLTSMRRSLPADAELSLVEVPKTTVPVGRMEFPLSGLEPPVKGTRIWRGYVAYGETLRVRIWARVSVCRRVKAVVAVSDLAAHMPIDAAHLRVEAVSTMVEADSRVAQHIEEVLGKIPKKLVPAGATIPLAILENAPAVRRGDAVRVEVQSGTARIQIDAIAETAAHTGEIVELRNPASGKTFRARLEAGSKAVIIVGAGQAL